MGWGQAIGAFFSAIGSFFNFQGKRSDLKNATDVKAAAKAQDEVNAQDKTNKTIAKQDVTETRNELAE